MFARLFQVELPPTRARLVNNVTHWAYGTLQGVLYGIVARSRSKQRVGYGLPFGAAVWAGDYVILPAAKLYKPIWECDAKTLAKDPDWAPHLRARDRDGHAALSASAEG